MTSEPPLYRPGGLPRLADGTELAGEYVGAGYREPPLLVYRGDGQVVRLPELLYQTVRALEACHRLGDPAAARRPFTGRDRVLAAVAEALTAQTGREYAPGHVEFLLDKKLAPLGVTTYSDGSPPELARPQAVLSLTCKMTMLSERATWFLAGLFTWLYAKPVLACAVPAILAAASWAFLTAPIAGAVEQTMQSPGAILLVVLLAIMSTAFHEVGHGTACRYGGVRPGVTGCGFYLAWPVFFTDITNSYRLGRAGRLRTDLGGVYFNGVFLLALTALYLATGEPVLLVAVLSTGLEAAQQLLPTLRFDGYYIIADLVGIPDLFKYIGPIIRRVLFRVPDDGRLAALKRWPQTIVTLWVLLVVPVLLGQLSLLAYNFPGIVRSDWAGIQTLAASSMNSGDPVLGVMSATVQILLLLFPLAGITLIAFRLLRGLARFALRRFRAVALAGRPAEPRTVPVEFLLEEDPGSGTGSGSGTGTGSSPGPERPRLRMAGDDTPAPRHGTRRAGLARAPGLARPLIGAAVALGLTAIIAWSLVPSSREGRAAELQPDKMVGVPATARPAGARHPGGPVPRTPGTEPATPGTEPAARPWEPGSAGPERPAYPVSPSATWPARGYRSSASGISPGSGLPSDPGGSHGSSGYQRYGYGPSATGNPSTAGAPSAPGAPSSAGSPSGPASLRRSADQSSPQEPSSPAPPSARQAPSSGQPSAGQPGQSSPGAPSSAAQWTPDASQPSQPSQSSHSSQAAPSSSVSSSSVPSGGWTSSQPPGSGSPSQSAQPSATASASQSPGTQSPGTQPPGTQPPSAPSTAATQSGCPAQIGMVLLTLIGLCPQ